MCGLGKAGKDFIKYVNSNNDVDLTTVLCRDTSETAGKKVSDVTKFHVKKDVVVEKISQCKLLDKPDVIIDFSGCATTMKLVDFCTINGINLVICPTDFTQEELESIKHKTLENDIGVVFAPTLTLGINVIMGYLVQIANAFPDFKFEIIERHPVNKPKPTRTAKYMSEAINRADVPISSIRLDGYVGMHEVVCADGLERVTISHETCSREAFARGAIFAAEYIANKKGFFTIKDVVGELLLSNM